MRERISELAPCGVFCGACPSYNNTCLGCASENKHQKRTSKWGEVLLLFEPEVKYQETSYRITWEGFGYSVHFIYSPV